MPLPKGTKYRFRKIKGGKEQRLAFNKAGKVIEVANYGKNHKKGDTTLLTRAK